MSEKNPKRQGVCKGIRLKIGGGAGISKNKHKEKIEMKKKELDRTPGGKKRG